MDARRFEVGAVERGEDGHAQQLRPRDVVLGGLCGGFFDRRLQHVAAAAGMDGDESGREFDHGADAAGHRVGDVVQLEVEEEAHARRPHRRRKGVAHARRAVRQEEFQPELDAADSRFRPAGNGLDEPGGQGQIDGVDAAITGLERLFMAGAT